jgi:UDP-2,3-diacylglucosamine hydrolase
MGTIFISDLHLDGGRPDAIRRFETLVYDQGVAADAVYILGDLFEAWIGDDDTDPAMKPVIGALAALARAKVPCRIMHGNHDFLLGRRFTLATGCTLLGDYETVDLYGEAVLLTHGDLLCTDDTRYMELRGMVRDRAWQRDFLGKPIAERKAIASRIRDTSVSEAAAKSDAIMDVNPSTVAETMRKFGVRRLLHGHTHRPAVHSLEIDGAPAERIVLGAWHEQGYVLHWDEDGHRVELI